MFIQTEQTPNPATLKFLPGRTVMEHGVAEFTDPDEAERLSPLARRIFAVAGISGVYLGSDFISVTKGADVDWQIVKPAVLGAVMEQLARSGITIDPSVLGAGALNVTQTTATLDASPTGKAADAALLSDGRPGTAFIREARDTGIDVHGDSVVEMTLDVTPQGGAPYEVRTAALVPAAAGSRALPGATVGVRIDQSRPDRLAFDWQA